LGAHLATEGLTAAQVVKAFVHRGASSGRSGVATGSNLSHRKFAYFLSIIFFA
jgi:hypothetical protein